MRTRFPFRFIAREADFLRRHWLVVVAALAVFAADQTAKFWVVENLALGESFPHDGFFRLTHAANTGGAFGLFGGSTLVLAFASAIGVAILLLFYRSRGKPNLRVQLSLGLLLGGALGNLADRAIRGQVTDYIDVIPWWIFNLADAAIVMSIVLFACAAPTVWQSLTR